MGRKKKIPENINTVIADINRLQTKSRLVKHYGCTVSGLESYLKRKKIKLVRSVKWESVSYEN